MRNVKVIQQKSVPILCTLSEIFQVPKTYKNFKNFNFLKKLVIVIWKNK